MRSRQRSSGSHSGARGTNGVRHRWRFSPRLGSCSWGLALALLSAPAGAQLRLNELDDAWRSRLARLGGSVFAPSPPQVVPKRGHHAVRVAAGSRAAPSYVLRGVDLVGALGTGGSWAPPRHLLLDSARDSLRVGVARAATRATGRGVVIGIVDSGVDIAHPDLRNADGTTRVAWWIDFSQNPAGRHPALESALGCQPEVGLRCRVLSGSDLDALLQNEVSGDEPGDALGHGTHVATIAAGNGAASDGRWAGVAPEATLIVARVTGAVGTIADSDVALATRFVFERAAELGVPAVVNLSLGSDFGAHDGSSQLGRTLASWVNDDQPGRAIVVAGGNSGEVRTRLTTNPEDRLGIHAELEVRANQAGRMPLLTPFPASGAPTTSATLLVWLNLYPAEQLSVGLVLPDGSRLDPVSRGQLDSTSSEALAALIIHGAAENGSAAVAEHFAELTPEQTLPSAASAVILIDGEWTAGESFEIWLEGEGRAEAWVQSEGDLAPEAGSVGALFANASSQQTVTIPAADPDLIAVGASINRIEWEDQSGASINVANLVVEPAVELGGAGFFSSAGPNAAGDFKPDLLAPGGFVIAGMAPLSDPRDGGGGVFASGLCDGVGCQVIADAYAVSAGTSMAAPMVSGAIALLLESRPELTQGELRGLLQAGSRPLAVTPDVAGREGGGVLDVAAAFVALEAAPRGLNERPSPEQSRVRSASAFALPDPSRSVEVMLWLRDDAGGVFNAEIGRVRATVSGGTIRRELWRRGPGLYALRVSGSADARSLLTQIDVSFDDAQFLQLALPIEVGERRPAARRGGGCAAAEGQSAAPPLALACWIAALGVRRRALRARRRRP